MLASERVRLLREDPWDATSLAQEIYAIWQNDTDPLEVGQSIQFEPAPAVPLFDLGQLPTDDFPIFTGKRRNGETFTINITPDGLHKPDEPVPGTSRSQTSSGVSLHCFRGVIVSGSGDTYQVNIFVNGVAQQVTATQMRIDAGETIPATFPVIVVKDNGSYFLQVPVWV